MTTLIRLVRSVVVFLGASVVLVTATAQFAPGWRPAPTQAPLEPLPATAPGTSPVLAVEREETTIPSEAGDPLRAWIVRPAAGPADRPVPGVVLVHGAGSGDRDSLLREAEALAAAGVAAIAYDKREEGYSFRSRDYAGLADDAIGGAAVLASQDGVDPDRIGIMGWSEGGWVAPIAVQRAPDRFAFLCVVSASIVSPLEQTTWAADRPVAGAPDWVRRVPATALSTGTRVADYLDTDIRPLLQEIQVPVNAVWGAEDPTVPVNVAVRRLTEHVDPPVTARVLPDAGHGLGAGPWLADAARWMISLPDTAVDEVRGTEPASHLGLASLPGNAWFTNPLPQTAVALGLAVAAWFLPISSRRSGPAA